MLRNKSLAIHDFKFLLSANFVEQFEVFFIGPTSGCVQNRFHLLQVKNFKAEVRDAVASGSLVNRTARYFRIENFISELFTSLYVSHKLPTLRLLRMHSRHLMLERDPQCLEILMNAAITDMGKRLAYS